MCVCASVSGCRAIDARGEGGGVPAPPLPQLGVFSPLFSDQQESARPVWWLISAPALWSCLQPDACSLLMGGDGRRREEEGEDEEEGRQGAKKKDLVCVCVCVVAEDLTLSFASFLMCLEGRACVSSSAGWLKPLVCPSRRSSCHLLFSQWGPAGLGLLLAVSEVAPEAGAAAHESRSPLLFP